MAIRGVNRSEREAVIYPDDPGHPDQIKEEVLSRMAALPKEKQTDEKRVEIEEAIAADPDFKPTVYYIGNLSENSRVELSDMGSYIAQKPGGEMRTVNRVAERSYHLVKRALVGWDNQLDYEGNPVEFKKDTDIDGQGRPIVVASDASMGVIPNPVRIWLAARILEKNGMTDELAKKSKGASPLSIDLTSETGDAPTAPTAKKKKEDVKSQQSAA